MVVFYSCLERDSLFFRTISRLNIINDENITNEVPIRVFDVGISSQIKYPNIIAKTNAKYFNGVTRETSENL